jgi:hypothetical protein
MKSEVLNNINKIIERESKSTTYKFALLRATIDIIQENSPFIEIIEDKVLIPTGLIVEKWLLYYYPIIESDQKIPQIHGNSELAFADQFKQITDYYKHIGGFSAFYNDLRNKGISPTIQLDFLLLIKKLKSTITQMPMRYIGTSINEEAYSIFKLVIEKSKKDMHPIDVTYIINYCGNFTIPLDYYDAFKLLGSFISGRDSILFKWAEFSVNASGKSLSREKVLNEVLKNPITQREISEAKKLYEQLLKESGNVYCVWSGKKITNYNIDHMIPFSIWRNNDLWNLLPAQPTINNQKKDKIPSSLVIQQQKDLIFYYWSLLHNYQQIRFKREIKIALLGINDDQANWQAISLEQLQSNCDYLINTRGFQEWKP